MSPRTQPIRILLVEDNPGDVELTLKALQEGKLGSDIAVATDGDEAMAYLRREGRHAKATRPDLVLLDLNLPKMDGREVLLAIKADERLREIPVVVLTSSEAERDIVESYRLQANCYVTKPVDLEQFLTVVKTVEQFWFEVVQLPQ
jgi:two-component system, chemotaxis family, response regulator Rcp1